MKKQTTKQKVLNLLSEGMKPKDIAAKLKIKPQQVYTIKSEAKKNNKYNRINIYVDSLLKSKLNQGDIVEIKKPDRFVVKKSFFQKVKEFMWL